MAEQQIAAVAASLEKHLCQQLGLPPLFEVVRNIKVKAIIQGTKNQVTESRNTKGYKEFLCMLKSVAEEKDLKVLIGSSQRVPVNQPPARTSNGGAAAAAPRKLQVPPTIGKPSPGSATISSKGGGSIISPKGIPSVLTALTNHPPAIGAEKAKVSSQYNSIGAQGMTAAGTATGVAPGYTQRPSGGAAAPRVAGAVAGAVAGERAPYNNPVYGQDYAASPVGRTRDYAPALGGLRSPSELKPCIKATGDLFLPMGPLSMPTPSTGLADDLMSSLLSSLPDLPAGVQELSVMNDVLYAFMGLDAKFVCAHVVAQGGVGAGATAAATQAGPNLTFSVDAALDPCLREMVEKVVPICEYVAVLQRFIETRSSFHHGLVSHAVAAALRTLLQDWFLVVTQLEHQLRLGVLSMQALVYYCQSPLNSLRLLASIAGEAASKKLTAAALLNLLHAKSSALAGDRAGRALVHRLLHAACVPYFRTLEKWLCEGVLDDPHGEFMVQEKKTVDKDVLTSDKRLAYWYQRYTIRTEQQVTQAVNQQPNSFGSPIAPSAAGRSRPAREEPEEMSVPVFLLGHVDMVLTTGKYLDTIRECGSPVSRPLDSSVHLQYDPHGAFLQHISAAHASASKALLQLLMHQRQLMPWLRSIKHVFLMDQGDLLVHLMEAASEELAKPAREISRTRLQSLLELAVKTSSVASDTHGDNISFDMDPRSLTEIARAVTEMHKDTPNLDARLATASGTPNIGDPKPMSALRRNQLRAGEELPGIELFVLSYKVEWPQTLIVAPCQLSQYQLIFKHLLALKHTERRLTMTWHRMQSMRGVARVGRDMLRVAYGLCHRLMYFIQEYLRYITFDVLEPLWATMEAGMRKAANMDEVIKCHNDFLRKALDGLLLSHPRILRSVIALEQ
eukprot:gene238-4000_t